MLFVVFGVISKNRGKEWLSSDSVGGLWYVQRKLLRRVAVDVLTSTMPILSLIGLKHQ